MALLNWDKKMLLNIKSFIRIAVVSVAFANVFTSCKKFVDISPPKTNVTSEAVFENDAMAISAIRGVYSTMIQSDGFASGSQTSVTLLAGLTADEFKNYSPSRMEFYTNSILS